MYRRVSKGFTAIARSSTRISVHNAGIRSGQIGIGVRTFSVSEGRSNDESSTGSVSNNVDAAKQGSVEARRESALKDGKSVKDFLSDGVAVEKHSHHKHAKATKKHFKPLVSSDGSTIITETEQRPVKFFIETYGCQMNVADSEIVHSILQTAGLVKCEDLESADLILANTCAIRENAEDKVWHRIDYFNSLKNKNRQTKKAPKGYPLVGVLGCMAERLKEKLLDEDGVDFVCGPDAYRDIPTLLSTVANGTDQKAANVQLSLEETYADLKPVRDASNVSSFVSIMRGCNNMCSYCIVPFTRGRERSAPIASIVQATKELYAQGVKEVVLLGQNVNSYYDKSPEAKLAYPEGSYQAADGFKNMYKKRDGAGARFADLLEAVATACPEMRIRFTSPHPKDFPDAVLEVIAGHVNVCKAMHMPAQSGSTSVLSGMRRGYDAETYEKLVAHIRGMIPGVTISTDMISGFCGESEADHENSVRLMRETVFDQAFMFAYSLRDHTHAARAQTDDVPEPEKLRRLQDVINAFRSNIQVKNDAIVRMCNLGINDSRLLPLDNTSTTTSTTSTTPSSAAGTEPIYMVVLVEGNAKRSSPEAPYWTGRSDGNQRCVFPDTPLPAYSDLKTNPTSAATSHVVKPGDYVLVLPEKAQSTTFRCRPIAVINSLSDYIPRPLIYHPKTEQSL